MKTRIILIGWFMMMWATCIAQDSTHYPIILSSRWFHPTSSQDTLSTINMIDTYHPDRIDWMYCTNYEQLAQLRERKIPYSLAINPLVPDSAEYSVHGRIQDINGNKLTAPWMRNWKMPTQYWGCVNAPEFKTVFYAQSRKLIDLGAYGLFMDDARLNEHTMDWGGCFCNYCMNGFTEYLRENSADTIGTDFNYRNFLHERGIKTITTRNLSIPLMEKFQNFQTESVLHFLREWRTEMEQYAKRPLTFLTNNYAGQWSNIYEVFDVGLAELPPDKVEINYIRKQVELSTKLRKRQYFTLSSDDESLQLKALFFTYAAGSALIIPWDVYVNYKSKKKPFRYFGNTKAFQPAYNLFRESTTSPISQFRSARKAATTLTVTAVSDSIHTYEYVSTSKRIVLIEAQSPIVTHSVIIKGIDRLTLNTIQVMYPEAQNVRIQQGHQQLNVKFNSNLMVLSLPLN